MSTYVNTWYWFYELSFICILIQLNRQNNIIWNFKFSYKYPHGYKWIKLYFLFVKYYIIKFEHFLVKLISFLFMPKLVKRNLVSCHKFWHTADNSPFKTDGILSLLWDIFRYCFAKCKDNTSLHYQYSPYIVKIVISIKCNLRGGNISQHASFK